MVEPEVLLITERFRVVRHQQPTAGGYRFRETIQHPGAVAVIPMIDAQTICLIQNYRVAINRTLIEIPAGTLEPGEAPAAAAERELLEETGYRATAIEPFGSLYMSPGILNERIYLFVAAGLVAGEMSLEPGEEIQRFPVTRAQAMEMIDAGEIQDAKTIAALLMFERASKQ